MMLFIRFTDTYGHCGSRSLRRRAVSSLGVLIAGCVVMTGLSGPESTAAAAAPAAADAGESVLSVASLPTTVLRLRQVQGLRLSPGQIREIESQLSKVAGAETRRAGAAAAAYSAHQDVFDRFGELGQNIMILSTANTWKLAGSLTTVESAGTDVNRAAADASSGIYHVLTPAQRNVVVTDSGLSAARGLPVNVAGDRGSASPPPRSSNVLQPGVDPGPLVGPAMGLDLVKSWRGMDLEHYQLQREFQPRNYLNLMGVDPDLHPAALQLFRDAMDRARGMSDAEFQQAMEPSLQKTLSGLATPSVGGASAPAADSISLLAVRRIFFLPTVLHVLETELPPSVRAPRGGEVSGAWLDAGSPLGLSTDGIDDVKQRAVLISLDAVRLARLKLTPDRLRRLDATLTRLAEKEDAVAAMLQDLLVKSGSSPGRMAETIGNGTAPAEVLVNLSDALRPLSGTLSDLERQRTEAAREIRSALSPDELDDIRRWTGADALQAEASGRFDLGPGSQGAPVNLSPPELLARLGTAAMMRAMHEDPTLFGRSPSVYGLMYTRILASQQGIEEDSPGFERIKASVESRLRALSSMSDGAFQRIYTDTLGPSMLQLGLPVPPPGEAAIDDDAVRCFFFTPGVMGLLHDMSTAAANRGADASVPHSTVGSLDH